MKLETLAEAGYHIEPTEYVLQNFFNLEDDDQDAGFQWWGPKVEYHIVIEFEDENHEVVGVIYEPGEKDHHIRVSGFEDELPSEYQLRDVEVFKQIWPRK